MMEAAEVQEHDHLVVDQEQVHGLVGDRVPELEQVQELDHQVGQHPQEVEQNHQEQRMVEQCQQEVEQRHQEQRMVEQCQQEVQNFQKVHWEVHLEEHRQETLD